MKHKFLFLLFSFAFLGISYGQSVSATYSAGDIPTSYDEYQPTCSGVTPLVVTLPGAGNWEVTSVDVVYDMTATGSGYMNEQRSMLACQESGTDEGATYNGTGTGVGTVNYSRTDLIFANGVYSGDLNFILQAWRTYGSNAGCDVDYQYVNNNSWTVTVHYVAAPDCLPVSFLTSVPEINSALLGWTDNGGATQWDIEYGATPYTFTGVPTVSGVSNPYTLSGLDPGTEYTWKVRTDCGAGSTSSWSVAQSFTTICEDVTVFPHTETFSSWPPSCWDLDGGTFDWQGASSDYAVAKFYNNQQPKFALLTSPLFDVSGLAAPTLAFDWSHLSNPSYLVDELNVLISDDDGATWTSIWNKSGADLNSNDGATAQAPGTFISSGAIDLSSLGNTILLKFHAISGYGSNLFIDNVSITGGSVSPTTATWTGETDHDWATSTNWSDDVLPGTTTAVTIPITGVTNFPTLTVAATVASVTMEEEATIVGAQHLTITGEFTYSKHLDWADEYHYLSSPVGAIDIADVFPEENINDICMYNYDESEQEWVAMDVVTPGNNAFVNGMGYNIHRTTGSTLGSYDVTFNKTAPIVWADVLFPNLSVTGTVNNYSGWHLLGNPFPAGLDWDDVTYTNIEDAVYTYNGGNYISYNDGTGIAGGILPVGQGFMVKATDATNTITLPADAAVHSNLPIYKASTSALRLDVTSTATTYHDATFVRFANGATTAYDNAFDARKLFGLEEAPALYTQIEEQTYSINAVNEEVEAIALNFQAGVDGSYTITATEVMSNGTATLEDLQTGETVELDATAAYTFDATTADAAERFVLHVKATTGVDTQVANAANIYAFTNRVYVDAQTSGEAMIYNVSGQLVRRMTVTKGLNSVVLDNGIYIVRLNAVAQKVSVQ